MTAYEMHVCKWRTPIQAEQINTKPFINKYISKCHSRGYIYEVWFGLNDVWLQLSEK